MTLFITEINFYKGYHFQGDGMDLKWSVGGLVVGEGVDECEVEGVRYTGGETIPWSALYEGKLSISYKDQLIPLFLRKPDDERLWIRFFQRPDFPGNVRLDAYQAYFGAHYHQLKLEGALSEDFFLSVLDAYDRIGLGSNNPVVLAQVRLWKERFMSFLTSGMVDADPDEDPGRLSKTVARIKNLSMEL